MPISTNLSTEHPWVKSTQCFIQIWTIQFSKNKMFAFSKSTLWLSRSIAQMCSLIGTVSQVSDVAHGPLI